MDFKTATDRVAGCITHAEIAEACGVSLQSIRQARMDPNSPSYRNPPAGWEGVLARLARERARQLEMFSELLLPSWCSSGNSKQQTQQGEKAHPGVLDLTREA